MADGSTKVVLTALAGNLAIAVVKFVAYGFTRSSAMLTEAIHSLVDTSDQVFLLIGQKRGAQPPDETHPLGYGMETYFWSFIVALQVFLLGGAVGIWQGVRHILHPHPIDRPWISLVVLGLSALFEGASFMSAYREYRKVVRGRDVRLWRFLRISKDPGVIATLLEDGAAMAGLAIAAVGVAGSAWLHLLWMDGAASTLIGVLLLGVAVFLANETRSLIAGEAAVGPIVDAVRAVILEDPRVSELGEVLSLHLGPRAIMFAAAVHFRAGLTGDEIQRAAFELTQSIRTADARISLVFLRPGG